MAKGLRGCGNRVTSYLPTEEGIMVSYLLTGSKLPIATYLGKLLKLQLVPWTPIT